MVKGVNNYKMHKYLTVAVILFFIGNFFLLSSYTRNLDHEIQRIVLDKENKTLTAPLANTYEWYLDGVRLLERKQTISIKKSGEYSLVLTNSDGEKEEYAINLIFNTGGEVIVVYTIGDSTVQDYNSGYYPRTGWGQIFQYFFDEEHVIVDNRAAGGTSSKSFYNLFWKADGEHSQIVNELDTGDYVFIQFGINDAAADPERRTEPFGSFQDYLTLYVEETKAKGAIPIIVATLRRSAWNDDGTPYSAYHGYPVAARELAAELNVPLVDLDKRSGELMNELGKDYISPFWYMNLVPGEYNNYPGGISDNVHFQKAGAIEMARLVIQELQDDTIFSSIDTLSQYIKEMKKVSVINNEPEGGLVTRTQEFPEGIEVTLKGKPEDGYAFQNWEDESGEIIDNKVVHTFTMGSSDTSFVGNFRLVGLGETEVWAEAECGVARGGKWEIVDDDLASNGQYLTVQAGNTSGDSPPGVDGRIKFNFEVEVGFYNFYGRILMPSVEDDSFWMRIDEGAWIKVTWDVAIPNWEWREMMTAELASGKHTLTVAYREDGALLDKIHVGITLPTGMGSNDNCCCTISGIDDHFLVSGFTQNIWTDNSGVIHVQYELDEPGEVSFMIYNSNGQSVLKQELGLLPAGTHMTTVDFELPAGIYFMTSFNDHYPVTQKFIMH